MDDRAAVAPRSGTLSSSLAWAALLALAVLVGRVVMVEGSTMNVITPAAGVAALWALLHWNRSTRVWDAGLMFTVVCAVHLLAGAPALLALVFATSTLGQAVILAALFHRWTPAAERGAGPLLDTMRGLGALLVAALVATSFGAAFGTAAMSVGTGTWSLAYAAIWQTRCVVAILVIVPLGLRIRQMVLVRRGRLSTDRAAPFFGLSGWRWAELGLAVVVTELGNTLVFVLLPTYPILFPLFAVTAWVALRFSTSFTALRNVAIAAVAVLATLGGSGPFALIPDLAVRSALIQLYAGMGALLGLALSLSRDERAVLLRRVGAAATAVTDRARQVQVMADASRNVLLADDARTAVCEAVRDATGADGVYLLESDGVGHLVSTAVVGLDMPLVSYSADPNTSLTAWVFDTGKSVFIPDFAVEPRVSQALVERLGITSGAWHPAKLGDDRVVAIIGLGWREPIAELPVSTSQVLDVLAHEAARAIERADLVQQLAHAAERDPLTGLANRRRWDELSRFEVARAQRSRQALTLMLIDLDHFKSYNDSRGHIAGDVLLRDFADAANGTLRDGDLLARWGGEEFAVALPDCTAEQARIAAERILSVVPHGQTATVGIAQWRRGEGPADTLDRADTAMYEGKRNGRAQVVVAGQPAAVPA